MEGHEVVSLGGVGHGDISEVFFGLTPLGYHVHLRKTLCPYYVEQYTENNIWGDYFACTLEVYREWHRLDNPSERTDF